MHPFVLAGATEPLWERLVVAAVGPLVTVLVGGLAVWCVTSSIQRRREGADTRRTEAREEAETARTEAREDAAKARAEARENAQNALERRARDDALRHELVDKMSDSAGPLYLMTQHYWRAKRAAKDKPEDPSASKTLADLRPSLDQQYLTSRATGVAIEHRLAGYYEDSVVNDAWHRVQDLLTVRYFQLIDQATDILYERNAGARHTGLTVEELRNPKNVTDAYHESMAKAVRLVFTEDLRARSDEPARDAPPVEVHSDASAIRPPREKSP